MAEKHQHSHQHQNVDAGATPNTRDSSANFSQKLAGNEQDNDLKNQFLLLQEQIVNYEKQIADLKESLMRSVADADNQKKRHAKDLESTAKYGTTSVLKDIIDPFEQLFIALSMQVSPELQNHDLFKSMISGLEMTRQLFEKALAKHGLVRIYPKGEKFNHDTQQAISQVKQEGVEAGIVIDVVQAGYMLHDRIIKPALVVVSG
jgi:molecular chaperone GrpE